MPVTPRLIRAIRVRRESNQRQGYIAMDEIYKPPESDLTSGREEQAHRFFIVSRAKLAVLYLSTLGLYALYWFYINWRNFRDATGEKIMPLPRAIFYIFFTHSLFRKVDANLKTRNIEFPWSPGLYASVFVILAIAGNILDRLSFREIGSPFTDVASIALLPVSLLLLLKAQQAINLSLDDPEGDFNSRFTVLNYLWIALGVIFWALIALGLLEMFGVISFAD